MIKKISFAFYYRFLIDNQQISTTVWKIFSNH